MPDPTPRNIELAKRVVFDSTHAEMAVLYALALDDLSERDEQLEVQDLLVEKLRARIAELEAKIREYVAVVREIQEMTEIGDGCEDDRDVTERVQQLLARIAALEARLEELRSVVQSPDSLDYGDRVVIAAAKACGVPNPYTGELDA